MKERIEFRVAEGSKWFRDLAISEVIMQTMEGLRIEFSRQAVNVADIRKKYQYIVQEGKPST